MSITIKELAKIVGVSHTTVLKALHDRPKISNELKERIKKVAKEHNYIVNTNARNLALKQNRTIGLILTSSSIPMMAIIAEIIENEMRKFGYHMVLIFSNNNADLEEEAVKTLLELHVAGIFIAPTYKNTKIIDMIKASKIPFIILGKIDGYNVNYITFDDHQAVSIATQHLLDVGHKHIACLIHGPIEQNPFKRWKEGFVETINKEGPQKYTGFVYECSSSLIDGYRFVLEIFNSQDRPTAIISCNDLLVFGILKATKELGLRIPHDISIVALHDNNILDFCDPPITAVPFPAQQLGIMAAQCFIDIINGDQNKNQQLMLKTQINIRCSTARPKE